MPATQTILDIPATNTFSDASQHTLSSHPADPDCAGWLRAIVCAIRVSDGATKEIILEAGFKRASGNVAIHSLVQVSASGSVADLVALATANATIDAIGTDVIVRVEGLAGTEIDWSSVVRGMSTNHVAE